MGRQAGKLGGPLTVESAVVVLKDDEDMTSLSFWDEEYRQLRGRQTGRRWAVGGIFMAVSMSCPGMTSLSLGVISYLLSCFEVQVAS